MLKLLPAIAAALLLSACAATSSETWQKPGASAAQIASDQKICEYEAERAGAGTGNRANPLGAGFDEMLNVKKLGRLCMESRGYAKAEAR